MIIPILLAILAAVAGYFIHQKFNKGDGVAVPKPDGSKREKASKRESKREALASNRSVYNTAAGAGVSTRSVAGDPTTNLVTAASGRETVAPAAGGPESPRDSSSRDVKTARSPAPSEAPADANNNTSNVYGNSAFESDNNNNAPSKVSLVKDLPAEGEGGAQSPIATTAAQATPSEIIRGNLVNLPDSTAKNVSPAAASSNREVKPDPATATAITETAKSAPEKVKAKKRSSDTKKSPKKKSPVKRKSTTTKSSDGASD